MINTNTGNNCVVFKKIRLYFTCFVTQRNILRKKFKRYSILRGSP